jgi:hypothetical protein
MSICAAAPPGHVTVELVKWGGFSWGAKGDSLRRELPAALIARFGADAVTVR